VTGVESRAPRHRADYALLPIPVTVTPHRRNHLQIETIESHAHATLLPTDCPDRGIAPRSFASI